MQTFETCYLRYFRLSYVKLCTVKRFKLLRHVPSVFSPSIRVLKRFQTYVFPYCNLFIQKHMLKRIFFSQGTAISPVLFIAHKLPNRPFHLYGCFGRILPLHC
jgi:hypothetical protein